MAAPIPAAALDLRVTAMGGLGDGIARLDSGEVVLLPMTVPGDRVQATLLPKRQGVLRAQVDAWLERSPQRSQPACEAFGVCGGCDLQHWQLHHQRAHKRDQLQRLVARDGVEVVLADLPQPAGQRRRARLHLRSDGDRLAAGMLAAGSDRLVATAQCSVLDPALEALRRRLGAVLQGQVLQGEVDVVAGAEGVVALLTGRPQPHAALAAADALAAALGIAGLDVQIGRHSSRWGLQEVTLSEADGPLAVRVDAAGFCQASATANRAIRAHVAHSLAQLGPFASAQELYAGSGNLTGLLLSAGLPVRAVEQDAAACRRLRRAVEDAGLAGQVEVVEADVEQALVAPRLSGADRGGEVWLLDPGRLGAVAACRAAARWRPRGVVYVSCALDKLARDLQILRERGYRVTYAALVDAFGWTVHAEAVVALSLPPTGPATR